MKWNNGLFLVARQRKEAWQSCGRASAGWLQLFPRGSTPKWQKIALKMGILSANSKKMEVLKFFPFLNQAFFFGIVVWDSNLLRHSTCNWGVHFKQRKTKISQKMSIVPFFHQALQLLLILISIGFPISIFTCNYCPSWESPETNPEMRGITAVPQQ